MAAAQKKKSDSKSAKTKASAQKTKRTSTEEGYIAPDRLRESMQKVLVELINLKLIAKQAHWNIVGTTCRDLDLQLDEVVAVAQRGSDEIAERMRALHATPDGRVSVVAKTTTLAELPAGEITTHEAIGHMVKTLDNTVGVMRDLHDGIDEDDPTTADILHEYIAALEHESWLISAEVREPTKAK